MKLLMVDNYDRNLVLSFFNLKKTRNYFFHW